MKPDALAILTLALTETDGTVPAEAHLLPSGTFRAVDGRPRDLAGWVLTESIATQVVARAAARQTDILIDYEHQSLNAEWNGQPAPAAGWFRALEWRDDGLHAAGIRWTERAQQMIAAREYRYISAVFTYLPTTGEVLEIQSVAVTNTPALDGLSALVAARRANTPEDSSMADDAKLAALTTERDAAVTELAALKAQCATLTGELAALKEKVATDAQAAEKAAHTALLTEALADGRIAPALRAWAEAQPLAALKAYLDAAPPAELLHSQTGGKAPTAALTKEEAEMAAKCNVPHDQFLKARGI